MQQKEKSQQKIASVNMQAFSWRLAWFVSKIAVVSIFIGIYLLYIYLSIFIGSWKYLSHLG
jgi:hypothetical protein